jgi:hypothetical protein
MQAAIGNSRTGFVTLKKKGVRMYRGCMIRKKDAESRVHEKIDGNWQDFAMCVRALLDGVAWCQVDQDGLYAARDDVRIRLGAVWSAS